MPKIMVVDDEKSVREVAEAYLSRAGYEVVATGEGLDALHMFEEESPDLIVLDLMLPGISGEEVCRRIRETSNVPILMLTAKTSEEERILGLEMGADDYLIKPFSPRELVARIRAIFRRTGQGGEDEDVLSFRDGLLVIYPHRHEVYVDGEAVNLTPTEFKVLLTLAQSPGRVFSRDQLATAALGYDYAGFDDTIYTHIKNLRQKVDSSQKERPFIRTVYGVGYKLETK